MTEFVKREFSAMEQVALAPSPRIIGEGINFDGLTGNFSRLFGVDEINVAFNPMAGTLRVEKDENGILTVHVGRGVKKEQIIDAVTDWFKHNGKSFIIKILLLITSLFKKGSKAFKIASTVVDIISFVFQFIDFGPSLKVMTTTYCVNRTLESNRYEYVEGPLLADKDVGTRL